MNSSARHFCSSLLTAKNLLSLLGGCVFLGIFLLAYSRIPGDYYQVRDDGVITLSHAKNLVDHGFIGVNPSGPRVEGYSAPLQFYVYAAIYAVTGIGYAAYCLLQTIVFTFLLGFLFARLLKGNALLALGLTALSAVFLTWQTSFFLWHGSGLENPITHAFFLASAGILAGFVATGRIRYPWAIVLFLASISRLDSAFHIAALLITFSGFWMATQKSPRGLYFSLVVFGLWGLYQWWRYSYFGDFLPNTAFAQGIDLTDRCRQLLHLNRHYISSGLSLSNKIISAHGVLVLLPFVPLLYFCARDRRSSFLLFASASLILSAYLNPLFFGRTLLDPARSTTHAAVLAAFSISLLVMTVRKKKVLAWVAPIILPAAVAIQLAGYEKPGYRCCSVRGFEATRVELRDLGVTESLPRPTIANPDLGAVSWHKDFNIVDIGILGSPVISSASYGPLFADYLFDYAAPDMIECHGTWSGRYYESLFLDRRFARMYQPVREERDQATGSGKGHYGSGLWIRKDILRISTSRERRLIDDLRASPSIGRLRQELASCQGDSGEACAYVARTAYRFLPEFKASGQMPELTDLFSGGAAGGFGEYVVTGTEDRRANARFLKFLMDHYLERELWSGRSLIKPIIHSDFDVHLANGKLIYLKNHSSGEDRRSRFFVEVTFKDGGGQRSEFGFIEKGYDIGGRCLVVHDLPPYEVRSIKTGQFIRGEKAMWEGAWSESP
jgi:hypothetical protein